MTTSSGHKRSIATEEQWVKWNRFRNKTLAVIQFVAVNGSLKNMTASSEQSVVVAERFRLDRSPERKPFPTHAILELGVLLEQLDPLANFRKGDEPPIP